ncbi:MAG: glycosyltransferase family 39 protein [Candidatus Staskawiczbacteria bacterium]|nr:glycosyltransferase family 39 protein [Candidatus Staskawiczbacteria bacterium]
MEALKKVKEIILCNKILFFILVLTFIISVGYSFYFRIHPLVDAKAYDVIAQNLVKGFGYRENLDVDILHDYAISRVGPLYEFFLAGVYKTFGHHYEAVWLLQALFRALSAWLIYATVLLVFKQNDFNKKTALVATIIFGLNPDLIEISAMLMIETLYLFLLCLMLYLFFLCLNKSSWWKVLILGLVSGLAILSRPPIIFFVPIIIFFFWQRKKIWSAFAIVLIMITVFLPWTVRNWQVFHQFMPLGSAGAYNFWIGNYPGASGEQEQPQEALNFIATHPISDLQAESTHQFTEFVLHKPGEFVKLTFLRVNKYFSVVRPMGFWFYQKGLGQLIFVASSGLFSIFLFIFGLAGLFQSFRLKQISTYYLIAFTLITPLIIFVTVVETRYRFQIYPLLSLFAGYYVVYLWNNKKIFKERILWSVVSAVFLNGLLDLFLSFGKFKEKLGGFF